MLDLFDQPIVPGLTIQRDIVSRDEEAGLIAEIDKSALGPFLFQQWTGKRLTKSFGWQYDFETGTFGPTDPIPDWLDRLKGRAAQFARLTPADLVQALIIRYDPGAGIGWHKDRPVFEHIVGISLGHPAVLRLRRRGENAFVRAKAELAPRSIYHLAGQVRHEWEHSIAPMDVPRWSITFRSLRSAAK